MSRSDITLTVAVVGPGKKSKKSKQTTTQEEKDSRAARKEWLSKVLGDKYCLSEVPALGDTSYVIRRTLAGFRYRLTLIELEPGHWDYVGPPCHIDGVVLFDEPWKVSRLSVYFPESPVIPGTPELTASEVIMELMLCELKPYVRLHFNLSGKK